MITDIIEFSCSTIEEHVAAHGRKSCSICNGSATRSDGRSMVRSYVWGVGYHYFECSNCVDGYEQPDFVLRSDNK